VTVPRIKWIISGVVLLVVGFVAGQVVPPYLPASWQVGNRSNNIDFGSLDSIYGLLQRKYDGQIDSGKVMDSARAGVVASAGDPYTVYMDAKAAKELDDQLTGTLSGVGAEVGVRNNKLTVISPVVGSPAEKAGLRAGDWITRIDETDTSSLTLDEAVGKIRGDKGTQVKLEVVRGSNAPTTIAITRDVITVPSVKWSMKEGGVGYIQLSQFGTDTTAKIQQAASELKAQGASKIVLDLRNDPGGFLDVAVDVASQFLPADKVVVEERHSGKSQHKLESKSGGQLVGLPLVVLINGGSASASEIVAGALKDQGAAKLVGEKSFGKGSVQEVIKLGGGAQLKVTVAHWFTPSGKGIDKEGIKPDIEVKREQADYDADRDPQLDRALSELK
jgi:carboxyl-terminal processing protease